MNNKYIELTLNNKFLSLYNSFSHNFLIAGGLGSTGKVVGFENVAPDSSRNVIRVEWGNGNSNSYRIGFKGHVDLTCVEEIAGMYYYKDHLPVLSKLISSKY